MAESISVNFKGAAWDDIKPVLDSLCRQFEPEIWHFPEQGEWCLRVYPYDELLREYEDDAKDHLEKCLGGLPTSILCIELRRSLGNLAIDCADKLAMALLERFDGVVDDLVSDCWTLEDITSGVRKKAGSFLDCYRCQLQK